MDAGCHGWRNVGWLAAGLCAAAATMYRPAAQTADAPPALQLGSPIGVVSGGAAGLAVIGEGGSERLLVLTPHGPKRYDWRSGAVQDLAVPSPARAISGHPNGRFHVLDARSRVHAFDDSGKLLRSFRVAPEPFSIATLSDGSVVIAGPSAGRLFHLYSPLGQWVRSFGSWEPVEAVAGMTPKTLHRGVVDVDAQDNIVFVTDVNPSPYVVRYSPTGDRLAFFRVEGTAVEIQREASHRLRTRRPNLSGGIEVITALRTDPLTGNIWIGLNGSTTTALLYEYDPYGRKLREYRVANASGAGVSAVGDLAVSLTHIYLVSQGNVFAVPRAGTGLGARVAGVLGGLLANPWRLREATVHAQDLCGNEVTVPDCSQSCPVYGQPSQVVNCKDALMDSLSTLGQRIVSASCSLPGNGCSASAVLCRLSDGATTSHSTSLNCPDPCSGGGCPSGYSKDCNNESQIGECDCCLNYSPILIDLGGNQIRLSNLADSVVFDINGSDKGVWVAWPVDADDGFLFLDRNGNAAVDDGAELFGNTTLLADGSVAEHGYAALRELDANHDGVVDSADPQFGDLRLWSDANRNGISEAAELVSLLNAGIVQLSTDARASNRRDRHGNRFRFRAEVTTQFPPTPRYSYDVFPLASCVPPQ